MKSPRPASIKEVLARTIEGIVSKQEGLACKEELDKAWETIVGKEASKHSRPAQFKGQALIVNVDSPVWVYQLNIKKDAIEQELNRLIGKKSPFKVIFRAGES